MTVRLLRSADLPSVKVAYTATAASALRKHPLHDISEDYNDNHPLMRTSMSCSGFDSENQPPSSPSSLNMPAATESGSLLASLPTFMSVFGESENVKDGRGYGGGALKSGAAGCTNKRPPNHTYASSPLFRKDSSVTFESVESSPTTTISTMDTTLTEPSPSSSPESPNAMAPRAKSIAAIPNGLGGMDQPRPSTAAFPTFGTISRGDSPNKKMRNMKNLSVNTTSGRPSPSLPQIAMSNNQAITNGHAFSAPPTPSFVVPPKPPRKRPSTLGLSIMTPESSGNNPSFVENTNIIPPTPQDPQARALSYLQTASNAPLIGSPKLAPEGGMKLPPFPVQPGHSRPLRPRPAYGSSARASFDSNNSSSPITKQTLDHVQEECDYDPPLSKEAKSPAYPDGPICIYDPAVFLYLEPSRAEASNFDVIINVAREVLNPFASVDAAASKTTPEPNGLNLFNSLPNGQGTVLEPLTAVSDKSFASALESQMEEVSGAELGTPTTVRVEPEYIHIPWDHNTNVVEDLLRLCETIDERVRQHKRVLVHCQCGVSRSASLIVAYGLFKNPELTVQEAYDTVKGRSRWIGPNMNLIYQLSEFKSKLPKRSFNAGPASWHSWRPGPSRSGPSGMLISAMAASSGTSSALLGEHDKAPLSAPFSKDKDLLVPKRADTLTPSTSVNTTGSVQSEAITPGPSSAPPDMQWSMDIMAASGFPNTPWSAEDRTRSVVSPLSMQVERSPDDELSPHTGLDVLKSPTSSNFPASISGAMDIDSPPQMPLSPPPPPPPSRLDLATSSTGTAASHQTTAFPPPPVRAAPRPKPSLSLKPSTDSLGNLGFSRLAPSFSPRPSSEQQPRALPLRQEGSRFPPANPSPQIAYTSDDPPPTPSMLSPRAVEFTTSPFHRTLAGDLAGSSMFEQEKQPPAFAASPNDSAGKPTPTASSPFNLGFAPVPSGRGLAKKNSSIFEQLQGVPTGTVGAISEQTIEILPQPRDEYAKLEDPRSPVNVEGEAGVVRSIFDVL